MTYLQHFFIEDRLYGSAPRGPVRWNSLSYGMPPVGSAFFCPDCTRLWAIFLIESRPTLVSTLPCERHGPAFTGPGGSIWLSWDEDLLEALPLPVLQREFHLQLNQIERNFPCQSSALQSSTNSTLKVSTASSS